jgi:hypothetical protein
MLAHATSALQTFFRSSQTPSHSCSSLFPSFFTVFDKFMNDLTASWQGIYSKHLPTAATGPHHGLFKKGRLPLSFSKTFGHTGAFTGAHHIVDEIVSEKTDAANSVKTFFQDVRTIFLTLINSLSFLLPSTIL